MNYSNSIWTTLFVLLASCHENKGLAEKENNAYFSTEHLIEVSELKHVIGNENSILIDFRKPEEYITEHIAGALNVWRPAIENPSYPYQGMIAEKSQVEELLGRLGAEKQDTLIIYDNRGMADAARFWWVLKNYNYESVKLLNGSLQSWKKAGGQVNDKLEYPVPSKFALKSNNDRQLWIDKNQLMDLMRSSDKELTLIDTRTYDEYSGKRQKNGAVKAGRIPNSIHIDWAQTIDYEGTKKFRPIEELEKVYSVLDTLKTNPIVVYCHSGSRSAHTTFVLTELMGYKNVKNYDGSWIEWSHFENLPFERDSRKILNE